MRNQDTIENLLKREEELERLMMGPAKDGVTTPEEATENLDGTEEALTEKQEAVTSETQSATDVQPEAKRDDTEDWKLRYTNLRSSRDENLYRAKAELADAKVLIGNLQSEIIELRQKQSTVDPLEGVFTAEDTDALGEATVSAMRKATAAATAAATKPLQEQLERERAARMESNKSQAETTKRQVYDIFLSRIARAVPDWEAINFDPAFKSFMDDVDVDGIPRKTYFADAEARGNAALVIRYMQEFKGTRKAPPIVKDKLADKVTPVGSDAGATQAKTPNKTDVVTRAYINKFYDDLNRGKYEGKYSEAMAIEAAIDKATMEGRIR